jgi:hypothetical protein
MAHLQLWHPGAGLSVLTPSALTAGRFEAFPVAGWKARTSCYGALYGLVWREAGVALPGLGRMAALYLWFIKRAEREAAQAGRPSPRQPGGR